MSGYYPAGGSKEVAALRYLTGLTTDRPPTNSSTLTKQTGTMSGYIEFTPSRSFSLAGIRIPAVINDFLAGDSYQANVWRVSDATLVGNSTAAAYASGVDAEFIMNTPIMLTAGVAYRIGVQKQTANTVYFRGYSDAVTYEDFDALVGWYYWNQATNAYPQFGPFNTVYSPYTILEDAGSKEKGVVGPLEPVDLRLGRGASAARPATTNLPAGESLMFFDTTLNKPIWFNGTNWVDATGTVV